ncbi:MAG: hypothetical protein K1X57_15190 [Gemmataceae bacterium]|nr:hypothetical protein [Gemmataceae bacterium]
MHDPLPIEIVRLTSTLAELRLKAEGPLHGRLTGPHCPNRTTLIGSYVVQHDGKVLIPDPCLWTAETPYTYRGTVTELLGEVRVDHQVEVGLKFSGGKHGSS